MLDVFAALFVLAAFATLRLRPRRRPRAHGRRRSRRAGSTTPPAGPRLGRALVAASATGVLLGLGCAVKWSGIYWLAAFARAHAGLRPRRRAAAAGVRRPWVGTLVRDVAAGRVGAGPAPGAGLPRRVVGVVRAARPASTATSSGSTAARTASARAVRGRSCPTRCGRCGSTAGTCWSSTRGSRRSPRAAPVGVQAVDVADGPAADALLLRAGDKVTGCGDGDCVSAVMLIGTPALWWPALAVLAWALWRAVTRVDWRYGAVLVGYGGGHRCRGSPTSTARCTSSTWRRSRRSSCSPRCWSWARSSAGATRRRSAGRPACWRRACGWGWSWPTSRSCGRSSPPCRSRRSAWDAQLWLPSWRP